MGCFGFDGFEAHEIIIVHRFIPILVVDQHIYISHTHSIELLRRYIFLLCFFLQRDSSRALYNALLHFVTEVHPEFAGRPLFLAGESYAGNEFKLCRTFLFVERRALDLVTSTLNLLLTDLDLWRIQASSQ